MAKNIKKRSASHIYFGVNKLTGELKHISEVPSGQKCDCICAACLQPFEARKGTRRRHHFAHVSNYECRPVVPAGPTQEELDAEYIRICQSYDPSSEEWTVDRYNQRWIMCTVCGRIKQDAQMSYYGGKGGANRGVCADCSRNGRS